MQNGVAWRSTNFALEQALDTIKDVMDTLMGFECPEDLTGAVKTACAITKNVGILVIQIICIILRIVSSSKAPASKHSFGCVLHVLLVFTSF